MGKSGYIKKLNSGGDTIVEVLIVLTILSLSFALSYATANAGLRKSRNAEEHSQALGVLNSQIELVRTAVAQKAVDTFPTHNAFCMKDASDVAQMQSFTQAIPATAGQDDFSGYPASCVINGLYYVSVSYVTFPSDDGRNYFEFRVRWPGAGTLGPQQESMSYKMPILVGAGAVYTDPPNPSPVLTPTVYLSATPNPGPPLRMSWTTVSGSAPIISTQCKYDTGAWFDCGSPYSQTYPARGANGESHTFQVMATNKFGTGSASYTWSWVTSSQTVAVPHTTTVYPGPVDWGYYCDWNGQCYDHVYYPPPYDVTTYTYDTQDTSHWQY